MSANQTPAEQPSNGVKSMGWFKELSSMVSERRVGFRLDEEMSGEHVFEPGMGPPGRHPMTFNVRWGAKHLTRFANPFDDEHGSAHLEGTVTIGGLCDTTPCIGTFLVDYFHEHRIRYTFDFQAAGKSYHYVGEKVNIQPWNLPVSHTTCYGTLTEKESGRLVSRSVTFFRMLTAPSMLASFRLA